MSFYAMCPCFQFNFICMCIFTIFGFAWAVVWLQQVALHTAAGVGALSVYARLTAGPVYTALIKIYQKKEMTQVSD